MSNIFYNGSDGYIHSLGDDNSIIHWKYIKKIKSGNGWRYFYDPEELRAYTLGAKSKIDSVPRLQKHGDKYYIADKKTQRAIDRSGVGGNFIVKSGKRKGHISDQYIDKIKVKEDMKNAKTDYRRAKKMSYYLDAANRTAKTKARESAYSQYEAKEVVKRKINSILSVNKSVSNNSKKKKKGKKYVYILSRK